jgi:hypothetical protein
MSGWQESEYKPEYCEIAAKVFAQGKSKAAVCAKLDISRPTLYNWCAKYPEFDQAVNRGMQKAQEYWEDLGEQGIKGDIEKFGAAPWIFTMKNRFREDYAEDKSESNTVPEAIVMQLIDRLVE